MNSTNIWYHPRFVKDILKVEANKTDYFIKILLYCSDDHENGFNAEQSLHTQYSPWLLYTPLGAPMLSVSH